MKKIKAWRQATVDQTQCLRHNAAELTRRPIQDTIHFKQSMWQIRATHTASVRTQSTQAANAGQMAEVIQLAVWQYSGSVHGSRLTYNTANPCTKRQGDRSGIHKQFSPAHATACERENRQGRRLQCACRPSARCRISRHAAVFSRAYISCCM